MDLSWPIAAARWLHLGSLLILLGAPFFALYVARQPEATRSYSWLAAVALVTGCCWLIFSLTDMADGVEGLSSFATWRAFFQETSFGSVWAVRLALLLALQACTIVASLLPSSGTTLAVCAMSAVLLGGSAWLGHAAASQGMEWAASLTSYSCHVLGAGAWLGGLVALSQMLHRFTLRGGDIAVLVESLERFSRVGILVVVVIAGSGIANAYLRSVTLADLTNSQYGRTLAIKLALFFALLSLAATNRWIFLRRLRENSDDSQALRSLYGSVVLEQLWGASIIAVAVVLGATPPTE
jgi:copper resistance protein D